MSVLFRIVCELLKKKKEKKTNYIFGPNDSNWVTVVMVVPWDFFSWIFSKNGCLVFSGARKEELSDGVTSCYGAIYLYIINFFIWLIVCKNGAQ